MDGVPVAVYASIPTDSLVPLRPGESMVEGLSQRRLPRFLACDPTALDWSRPRPLIGASVVAREEFQRALEGADDPAKLEALADLVVAIGENMPKVFDLEVPTILWVIAGTIAFKMGPEVLAVEQFLEAAAEQGSVAGWLVRGYRKRMACATVRDSAERLLGLDSGPEDRRILKP